MRRLPALRMIATCSIGTDMIDLALAKELGIVVSNQPGRTAPVVAEHIFVADVRPVQARLFPDRLS